jgi:REP element-mobilizing transposase RayT
MMQTESTVPTRAWPAYGYLASILNNAECPAMIIGGVADHVHILFELSRQACVAGLVGDLKASSSKWLKAQGVAGFAWQRGYGCFSVSRSNVSKAKSYIAEQPQHHQVRSFQDELRLLLSRHGVGYDKRYLRD